jgi:ribosomal protein RSM22 (predicted rRNA methylase)
MERVQLPDPVKRIIEERCEQVGFPALKRAASAMSDFYREGRTLALSRMPAAERTAAYLAARMPATFAASFAVLREVRERLDGAPVGSILDIGAGTGAASLAARHWFPEAAVTLLERDSAFAEAARAFLPEARILSADAANLDPLPPHDLIIAAYSLGELAKPLAQRLWQSARVALIVIEPGTPGGFTLIRTIRDCLLSAGAQMLAPCPAETACPIVAPDWCHFAARVERSSLHRRLKDGQLSYEDEKFSYIALGRNPVPLPEARIIRHPQHQPGLITLETCTAAGLRSRRVTKRDKDAFRIARKTSWGDTAGS